MKSGWNEKSHVAHMDVRPSSGLSAHGLDLYVGQYSCLPPTIQARSALDGAAAAGANRSRSEMLSTQVAPFWLGC